MDKNKKNKIIILVTLISALAIILVIFGFVMFFRTNKKYTEITPEKYSSIVTKNGYSINDITENLKSYGYIENAVMAVSEDETYEIEYYNFTDVQSATQFIINKMDAINMMTDENSIKDEVDNDSYYKYAVETDDYYFLVFSIGDTVICADVKIDLKDKVINVFRKLGYMN